MSLGMKLWKLNETTGYWDYQRNVTPETADEWRRRFQIDEPTATFRISKTKPIPPALRSAIRREHAERAAAPTIKENGRPMYMDPFTSAREDLEPLISKSIYRLRLNGQGYTARGMYFGVGPKLWEYFDGRKIHYTRAPDKENALANFKRDLRR